MLVPASRSSKTCCVRDKQPGRYDGTFTTCTGNRTPTGLMETLNQEQFNTIKELADMQVSIAAGRAELERIRDLQSEYMEMREKEGNERVAQVLKESHEALEQTSQNHNELTRYSNELKAFAITLKSFSTEVVTLFQGFKTWSAERSADLDEKLEELAAEKREMKILSVNISEDRKQLKRESLQVAEEMRLLVDRRGLLERGFAELKNKQLKHG